MKIDGRPKRLVLAAFTAIVASAAFVEPSSATIGQITRADLQGSWQIALNGNTGCGLTAMLVNVAMNNAGTGTGTVKMHASCGDSTLNGQTFQITSLNTNGSGTANLTCGAGCGWNFNIQVSPDRSTFNMVDVDPANPGNFLSGVAVHQ